MVAIHNQEKCFCDVSQVTLLVSECHYHVYGHTVAIVRLPL